MHDPIAYTYDADIHCPACAVARFGAEPGYRWVRESAIDSEGNPVGAISPWDDDDPDGIVCGTCGETVTEPWATDGAPCPACGNPASFCPGHGDIGDPDGRAILDAHDDGDHSRCYDGPGADPACRA